MRESVGVPYFVTKSCEARVVSIITSFSFLLFSSLASAFLLELIFLALNGPENHCERDCLPARNVLHTILRLLELCVNRKFAFFRRRNQSPPPRFDKLMSNAAARSHRNRNLQEPLSLHCGGNGRSAPPN